jgi:hypothetical protein
MLRSTFIHILPISMNHFLLRCALSILLLPLLAPHCQAQTKTWDADAGLVKPYMALLTATSNAAELNKITDGNDNTAWQSGAPLPFDFVKQAQNNILLASHRNNNASKITGGALINATDGNFNTELILTPDVSKEAWLAMTFAQKTSLKYIYLKCYIANPLHVISIKCRNAKNQMVNIGTFSNAQNGQWIKINANQTNITQLRLASPAGFAVQEIAALSNDPKESVTFDLQTNKEIGWIDTKHWAGTMGDGKPTATKIELFSSINNTSWVSIGTLNPTSLQRTITRITPTTARYLKIEYSLNAIDYNKVSLWETEIYDRNGTKGSMPLATSNPKTMNELLGINTVWGWGLGVYSDVFDENTGVNRFNQIGTHARNYHFMAWDLADPDDVTDTLFTRMGAGRGTSVMPWLNWDTEYKAWKKAGFEVESSINFEYPPEAWQKPYQSAYKYGRAFAEHFGVKDAKGKPLVSVLEVGNEPWKYPADIYQQILKGMSEGVKSINTNIKVFPGALQAAKPRNENSTWEKNYVGVRVTKEIAPFLDGLNVHHYSWKNLADGKRISVHPEHPESTAWDILADIRWRNQNMPNKPIYITEFGWDSNGATETCEHSECVSEDEQALYTIRHIFLLSRLGIERITNYFYANTPTNGASTLFTRSGLTGSIVTDHTPKKSFYAIQSLRNIVGNNRFLRTIQEDDKAYIYLYGDATGKPSHIVAWRPLQGNDKTPLPISIDKADWTISNLQSVLVDGKSIWGSTALTAATLKNNKIETTITCVPTIIAFNGFQTRVTAASASPISGIELLEKVCTDGELTLKMPKTDRSPVVYTILDTMGNHVRHGHIHDDHAHLDGLKAGTYFLKIHNFGLPTPIQKFIVP